jgi:acetyl-CoA synthetase
VGGGTALVPEVGSGPGLGSAARPLVRSGGRLNVAYNCLDRHLEGARRNKAALIWEGEPGDRRTYTYWDLHREVSLFANALKSLGVERGDRVAIYLPMVPEAAIAMLACARIGAPHSVVFGGFSPESLADRINDAGARIVITADGGYRRGSIVPLKANTDRAVEHCPGVEHVVVVARGFGISREAGVNMKQGRDRWYHDLMAEQTSAICPAEEMESEDLLYILYTSGTTGKPKGVVHTTGGYLTQVHATTKCVFDLREEDVYWCTADVGWVTGHSYIVYGPLSNGATVVMYEGAPDWPDRDRFWQICEKYGVTIFYTAPTAIRAFMKWGRSWPDHHDLSRLRLLGSVGEPINPEAWSWYHEVIGGGRCPIVDTWWQTETGAIMITPLPGVTVTTPGSATRPFPGIEAALLDQSGGVVKAGYLAITRPWPSMLRTIYGMTTALPGDLLVQVGRDLLPREMEPRRMTTGTLDPGPGGRRPERGGPPDRDDGGGERPGGPPRGGRGCGGGEGARGEGSGHGCLRDAGRGRDLRTGPGPPRARGPARSEPIARPEAILFSADLPKTRSGKIMRRLLKDIAEGRALGDTTTLADPGVVAKLKEEYEDREG